jgi:hypothetical protein
MMEEYFLGVTKTQIQVPDRLFAKIKKFARHHELSLAETFRRGAELLLEAYPEHEMPPSAQWQPPTSGKVGWKGLTAAELRDLAVEDQARNPFA